jgi:hypothetical protein
VIAFEHAPDPLFPLKQMTHTDFGSENFGHDYPKQKRGIL